MNKWGISHLLEREIIKRDKKCVYCGVLFVKDGSSKKQSATWEHIINDARIITRENIALCCFSCNASKGVKELSLWLKSEYCKNRNITYKNVSIVVKNVLKNI